jgi:hypothetical protein
MTFVQTAMSKLHINSYINEKKVGSIVVNWSQHCNTCNTKFDHCKCGKNKVKGNCKTETHTVQGGTFRTFNVPATTTNQVIFEDYTCNHNKTILTLRSLDPSGLDSAVPLTISITTRNCPNQIVEIIPGARTRVFQVEDLVRLTVTNPTASPGALGVILQKTFCICCDNKCDQVETHTINGADALLDFPVSVRTTDQVVFQDYTCNHNKTMIQMRSVVLAGQPSAVDLTVTITTRNCPDKIVFTLPALGTRAIQVEDFESLTVSNPSAIFGSFNVIIQKTFCICCDNQNNKSEIDFTSNDKVSSCDKSSLFCNNKRPRRVRSNGFYKPINCDNSKPMQIKRLPSKRS